MTDREKLYFEKLCDEIISSIKGSKNGAEIAYFIGSNPNILTKLKAVSQAVDRLYDAFEMQCNSNKLQREFNELLKKEIEILKAHVGIIITNEEVNRYEECKLAAKNMMALSPKKHPFCEKCEHSVISSMIENHKLKKEIEELKNGKK